MSTETELLERTLDAILEKHCTTEVRSESGEGTIPPSLWTVLDEAGVTDLAAPGTGAGLPDLVALAAAVGRAAAPVPLVEASGIAPWLVGSAGLDAPSGITTCAVGDRRDELRLEQVGGRWHVRGVLHRVPWGGAADHVAALAAGSGTTYVVVLDRAATGPGRNLAGEPRDTLHIDAPIPATAAGPTALGRDDLRRRGALLRAASMAGAMGHVVDLAVAHAAVREQFGRPIADFQAVAHHLVAIAAEAACADASVRAAALAGSDDLTFAVASAKVTVGLAAGVVTRRAHQVLGAIGVTQEHPLHWFSTRLWSWQHEFGTERSWSQELGRRALAGGAEALWPSISSPLGHGVPEAAR